MAGTEGILQMTKEKEALCLLERRCLGELHWSRNTRAPLGQQLSNPNSSIS